MTPSIMQQDSQPRSNGASPDSYTASDSSLGSSLPGDHQRSADSVAQQTSGLRLPPIRPAAAPQHWSSSSSTRSDERPCRRKRHQIPAACESCRKRKGKCDGSRPICAACVKRGDSCVFTVEPDLSRSENLRRRYGQLQARSEESEQLLHYLKTRSEGEALEILRRMRHDESDISSLLRYIKDGELLIRSTPTTTINSTFAVAPGVSILNIDERDHHERLPAFYRDEATTKALDPSMRTLPAIAPRMGS